MRRDRSARRGEIEPVICFNRSFSIGGCAPFGSFPQVHRNKPRRIAAKKRCDIIKKLPTNILGCRHLVPEGRVIFVQKAMVVAIVNDLTSAFLNFADVDQHSSGGIGMTAEYKVSHIVAAGAVRRGAFYTEKPAVFFRGKFRGKQSARSGEFDALADSKEHKRANMLPVIVQGSGSEHRHSCLCGQRRFSPLRRCSDFAVRLDSAECNSAGRTDLEVYVPTRSERNSERVRASSLKVPSKQDVFMTEFCFSTPRIIMQRCLASTTMPTPAGRSVFIKASAICTVRFS